VQGRKNLQGGGMPGLLARATAALETIRRTSTILFITHRFLSGPKLPLLPGRAEMHLHHLWADSHVRAGEAKEPRSQSLK
jgi:hypothetical protein